MKVRRVSPKVASEVDHSNQSLGARKKTEFLHFMPGWISTPVSSASVLLNPFFCYFLYLVVVYVCSILLFLVFLVLQSIESLNDCIYNVPFCIS